MQLSPDKTSESLDCVKADEPAYLLGNLQSLLQKQIEMARRSNFRRVEALAGQADSIVEKIVKTKVFEQPGFDSRREHLIKLYKKLELMLAAGKASVGKQLRQVGNVRKILHVYHNNS
jgi:hypothetical protein